MDGTPLMEVIKDKIKKKLEIILKKACKFDDQSYSAYQREETRRRVQTIIQSPLYHMPVKLH